MTQNGAIRQAVNWRTEKADNKSGMAKKAKSSLGVTFWVALLVFLVLVYAANKIDLSGITKGAGVVQIFGGDYRSTSTPESEKPEEKAAPEEAPSPPPAREISPPAINTAPPREAEPSPVKPDARQTRPPVRVSTPQAVKPKPQPEKPAEAVPAAPAPKTEAQPKPAAPAAKPAEAKPESAPAVKPAETVKSREAVLYFIRLSDSGDVTLAKIPREIRSADAPLTDTLRALAAGPTEKESAAGCTSLIPAGSKLLSVTVQKGVAYVNFDESFRFNSFGREGYAGQIRQIVYTATEFSTIQAVQILINGGKIDYLGSEGVYIGGPVGRDSI